MDRICRKCGKALKDGQWVKAEVLSKFRQISSSVSYAIEKPYDCLSMEHLDCIHPDTAEPEGL